MENESRLTAEEGILDFRLGGSSYWGFLPNKSESSVRFLKNGDILMVFNKLGEKPVWADGIRLDKDTRLQKDINEETWAQFFLSRKPAILIRAKDGEAKP